MKVDLYSHDDGSGKQRWRIEPPPPRAIQCKPLPSGLYQFKVSGGTRNEFGGEQLLSATGNGMQVLLYSHDDNTGRQKWNVKSIGFCSYYISIQGGTKEDLVANSF